MRDAAVAWAAVAAHGVAAAAMLLFLREGLTGDRIAYLASHRTAWTLGWLAWQLAALSLLAVYAALALRFRGALSVTAVAAATAGAAIDIAAQMRYIAILPDLRGEAFERLDRELEVLTGYAANGLYTAAFALLVVAGHRTMPRSANVLAIPLMLIGFTLAGAALADHTRLEIVTSAMLFPLFTLWLILIALWLRRSASSS